MLRNRSLERKLKQLVQPQRSDPDEDRVHIICANGTGVRVTIRDVRLITEDDVHVSLTFIGDTGDVIRPRKPNDIIARRRNPVTTWHPESLIYSCADRVCVPSRLPARRSVTHRGRFHGRAGQRRRRAAWAKLPWSRAFARAWAASSVARVQ